MRAAANALDRFSASLNALAMRGAMVAVVAMVLIATWQVIARYLLASPPIWTEELARYAMVWGGLLGASCAFRAKADPTLFPGQREKDGAAGAVLAGLRMAGAGLFIVPVLYYSFFGPGFTVARGYMARMTNRSAETLDIPMVVFGIAIPLAFTIIAVHLLAETAMRLSRAGAADQDGDAP